MTARRDGRRDAQSGGRRTTRPTSRGATAGASAARRSRHADGPGADAPFEERKGYCYVLAMRYTYEHPIRALIHGTIHGPHMPRIDHAWVELPDGSVWEPITNSTFDQQDFRILFGAREERRYNDTEAARAMLRSNHFGPWHVNPESHKEQS